MTTLIIKNLPETLLANLKERAHRNKRSENHEVVALLEEALVNVRQFSHISPPLKLRGGHRPSIDEIEEIIAQGRS